jgi:hypothetical protein
MRVPPLNRWLQLGFAVLALAMFGVVTGRAQLDPISRSQIELGYDEPLEGQDPLGVYAYYYYNNPDFLDTNKALRVIVAVTYADSELGFKHLLSPTTDVGIDVNGGGFADDYYEVRQGKYLKGASFDGYGGGGALNLYQLLDPGRRIPLNAVLRGGMHYATYDRDNTAAHFVIPDDQSTLFTRAGPSRCCTRTWGWNYRSGTSTTGDRTTNRTVLTTTGASIPTSACTGCTPG